MTENLTFYRNEFTAGLFSKFYIFLQFILWIESNAGREMPVNSNLWTLDAQKRGFGDARRHYGHRRQTPQKILLRRWTPKIRPPRTPNLFPFPIIRKLRKSPEIYIQFSNKKLGLQMCEHFLEPSKLLCNYLAVQFFIRIFVRGLALKFIKIPRILSQQFLNNFLVDMTIKFCGEQLFSLLLTNL